MQSEELTEKLYNSLCDIFSEWDDIKDINLRKAAYVKIAKDINFINWVFINKVYNIRSGLCPHDKRFSLKSFDSFKKAPVFEFLRTADIELSNLSGVDVYKKYCDNEKAIIFIDPPYISSCNSFYTDPNVNIYEYLCDNDIKLKKSVIVLCLENIWIIRLLFKNVSNITYYDKQYENTTRKQTVHMVIINK
jgi:hypothetical protein